jgi:hypothetical protein
VDGKVDGKFDASGAAADALQDAKDYADGKDSAMDARVKVLEGIDHAKLASDAAASAVATVLDDAPAAFDTLKEVADWINSDTTGAAALQIKVAENADAITDLTNDKQDAISDLETIRTGATAGAVAEQNAKTYADGLAGNYDASGSAATAEKNAKDYATGLVMDGENVRFDAAGSAAGAQAAAEATAKAYADELNAAMDERVVVLEGIDHDKIAADAAAAAVATVVDGAPEKFDTLKEVAQWIANSDSANSAADLVTRVTALEAIDHEAYVNADATVLADAKSYVDGKVDGKFDAAGAADAAKAAAIADAAAKYQVKGDYEVAGAAAEALNAAKDYVDGKVDGKFDAAGAAAQALADAKSYVDGKGYITATDLVFAEDGDIDALFA